MHERGVGKPWTAQEDKLLTQAVAIHGENDHWKTIALCVPGRTNKACRKRWLHSLSPNVKKSAWTPEEDQLLLSLYAVHHTKWAIIARHIPGRTDDACSKRYREALDPSLKRDEWTSEEDARLLGAYARLGGKWGQVGQELRRSGLGCRNRWRMLERRRVAATREGTSSSVPDASTNRQPVPESSFSSWDPQVVLHPQNMWGTSGHALIQEPTRGISTSGGSDGPAFGIDSEAYYSPTDPAYPRNNVHTSMGDFVYEFSIDLVPSSMQFMQCQNLEHQERPQNSPDMHVADAGASLSTSQQTEAVDSQNSHTYISDAADVVLEKDICSSASSQPGSPGSDMPSRDSVSPLATAPIDKSCPTSEAVSAARYYRTPSEKARNAVVSRRPRTGPAPRLSSNLPAATDPHVLAYACGHLSCWPADACASSSCFATSKELSDHNKAEHTEDMGGETPFKCGLAGCRRSWKSINGLQYHLQISKTHYQRALTSADPSAPVENDELSGRRNPNAAQALPKKTFLCPQPDCRKQYKQLSGLRYHLAHGHPNELPVQLDVIPPALVRKLAEKAQAKSHVTPG